MTLHESQISSLPSAEPRVNQSFSSTLAPGLNSVEKLVIPLGLASGLSALLLAIYGYRFNFDQTTLMPLIYRLQDSHYLRGDWWLNVNAQFGPYISFAWLLSFVPRVWLPQVLGGVWMINLFGLVLVILAISARLYGTVKGFFIGTFAVMIFAAIRSLGQGLALGANDLIYPQLYAQPIAGLLSLLALLVLASGHPGWAGIFTGLAINLHLNTGEHIFLLLLVGCATSPRLRRRLWHYLLISLIVAAPISLLFISRTLASLQLPGGALGPQLTFTQLAGYFRHTHHYIPSKWPVVDYQIFILFLLIGAAGWWIKEEKQELDRIIAWIVAAGLMLCLVGYVFVELIPTEIVTLSQFSRLTVWLEVLAFIYTAGGLLKVAKQLVDRFSSQRLGTEIFLLKTPLIALAAGLFIVALLLVPFLKGRIHLFSPPRTPMEEWVFTHTPPEAVFLIPPEYDGFITQTERAVVVDFKRFPFTFPDYLEWYDRIVALSGGQVTLASTKSMTSAEIQAEVSRTYAQLNSLQLKEVADRYKVEYVLRFKLGLSGVDWPVAYTDENWEIYAVP